MGREVNTYTIGFKGDSQSEHLISEKTSQIIGSKHSVKIFDPSELLKISKNFIEKLDEPNGDRSCIPTFLLCSHARTEVKVALGGDGGDELFSGYSRYPGLNKYLENGKFFNATQNLKAYLSFGLPVFVYTLFKGEIILNEGANTSFLNQIELLIIIMIIVTIIFIISALISNVYKKMHSILYLITYIGFIYTIMNLD